MTIINPLRILLIVTVLCFGPVCAGAEELYPSVRHISGDWAGHRSKLHEAGFEVGLTYTAEPAVLAAGGYEYGDTYLHNINALLRLDLEKRRLTVDRAPVALTPHEYALLAALMGRPGRVFTRDELLDRLFAGIEVGDDPIDDVVLRKPRSEPRRVHLVARQGPDARPVDLGPRDTQQAGLQADAGLPGFVAVLEGEGFRMEITQGEPDQYLRIALDSRFKLTHDFLRLPAGHRTLEMCVLDVIDAAP